MFEVVTPARPLERVSRALDMGRCACLTRWQRLRLVALAVILGAVASYAGGVWLRRAFPAPIAPLPPAVELRNDAMTVWRFDFEHRDATVTCFLAVYHAPATWRVECPQR